MIKLEELVCKATTWRPRLKTSETFTEELQLPVQTERFPCARHGAKSLISYFLSILTKAPVCRYGSIILHTLQGRAVNQLVQAQTDHLTAGLPNFKPNERYAH